MPRQRTESPLDAQGGNLTVPLPMTHRATLDDLPAAASAAVVAPAAWLWWWEGSAAARLHRW
jgi:hypothetical protein